jgi:hypothetical protein
MIKNIKIKIKLKMKKFGLIGMVALGVAILAGVNVNVNLSSKSSNMSGVALKNYEALTQENQGDWHSGECGTDISYDEDIWDHSVTEIKECDYTLNGWMCEYGEVTTYYYFSLSYSVGSFSTQYCQGR